MKKFGTPGLAAPGCASEKVGLLCAGGWAWSSGTDVGVGVGVATLPVSDSVLAAPVVWLAVLSTFGLVLMTGLGAEPRLEGERGVAVAVGLGDWVAVGVGETVTVTVGAAVGV